MSTPPNTPLYERDPVRRFSDRGQDYRRYRPSYPSGAIDAVLAGLGETRGVRAADVGAGTGISALLLAERGVQVTAVEPNAAMRAQAPEHPNVTWVEGTAERSMLADGGTDLVLCAQSFHWFDPRRALREFARILRPAGRVALVWNDRDERDGVTREYGDLLRVASGNDPVAEGHTCPEPLFASPFFCDARRLEFANDQALDVDGLVGRALSASYIPKHGEEHDRLVAGLRAMHGVNRNSQGLVRLVYVTRVFLAEVNEGKAHVG